MKRRDDVPFRMHDHLRTNRDSRKPALGQDEMVDPAVVDELERAYPLRPLDPEVKRRHLAAITQRAAEQDPTPQLRPAGPAPIGTNGTGGPGPMVARLMPVLGKAAAMIAASVVFLGGAASAGILPGPIQLAVARLGDHLGIDLPGEPDESRGGSDEEHETPRPERQVRDRDESDRADNGGERAGERGGPGSSQSEGEESKSEDRNRGGDRTEAQSDRNEDRSDDEREREEETGDPADDSDDEEREREDGREEEDDDDDDEERDDDDDESDDDDDND